MATRHRARAVAGPGWPAGTAAPRSAWAVLAGHLATPPDGHVSPADVRWALATLQRMLGERVLAPVHPLGRRAMAQCGAVAAELHVLAQALWQVRGAGQLAELLQALRNPERLEAGLTLLDCGRRLADVGLDITFGVPAALAVTDPPSGLVIRDSMTHDALAVVAERLFGTDAERPQRAALAQARQALTDAGALGLVFAGRLDRWPVDAEVTSLQSDVTTVIDRARDWRRPEHLTSPEFVRLAVAHEDHVAALSLWAHREGLSVGVLQPPAATASTEAALASRLASLASRMFRASVLVLDCREALAGVLPAERLRTICGSVLRDAPEVAAVVVALGSSRWQASWLGPLRHGAFWVQRNAFCERPIAAHTLTRIQCAFQGSDGPHP